MANVGKYTSPMDLMSTFFKHSLVVTSLEGHHAPGLDWRGGRRVPKPKLKQKAQLCFIEKNNNSCQELGMNLHAILMIEEFKVTSFGPTSNLFWA